MKRPPTELRKHDEIVLYIVTHKVSRGFFLLCFIVAISDNSYNLFTRIPQGGYIPGSHITVTS